VSDRLLSLRVVFDDRVKTEAGWEDRPVFFSAKVLGSRASALAGILTKGMQVTLHGRVTTESWETRDGQKREKPVIIVDDVTLPPRSTAAPKEPWLDDAEDVEEIPF
jgi:single-strand DNA-binding protein